MHKNILIGVVVVALLVVGYLLFDARSGSLGSEINQPLLGKNEGITACSLTATSRVGLEACVVTDKGRVLGLACGTGAQGEGVQCQWNDLFKK